MTQKRFIIMLMVVAVLLSIPVIAMQFTTEVDWKILDFAIMGFLLFGLGLVIEYTIRKVKTIENRILICSAILFLFLLIWAELAVGIFGTPLAGS